MENRRRLTSSSSCTAANLLRGFVRRDEGGVVVLAKLQQQGYAYLRP